MSERLLLTGANGFIGGRLLSKLCEDGNLPRLLARRPVKGHETIIADLQDATLLDRAVSGIETIVHCAGFSHAFEERDLALVEQYYLQNFRATLNLAEAAARAGVRRFVFCSSVKAMGTTGNNCVDEQYDMPPDTIYGWSKRTAEDGLKNLSRQTGMEIVILRLSMVYGPGSYGNIERMLSLVVRGMFPPLPDTGNHRSMVFIDDAVSALRLAERHPDAAGGIFIVAHPHAYSGHALFRAMCMASGRRVPLFDVPEWFLRSCGYMGDALGRVLGKRMRFDSQVVSRLLDSAWYSSSLLQSRLGWQATCDLPEGLAVLVAADQKSVLEQAAK